MTNTTNDTHLTAAEVYRILTSAVGDTWDFLLANGVGDEFVKSVSFTTVAGQKEYAIDTIAPAGDFYKVQTLYVDEGNGQLRPITRINPFEEQAYRAPVSEVPMKLYYVPCAPVWTTGLESFDGINGWEEHVLCTAAMTIKAKKNDDYRWYANRKMELEKRIQGMAGRSPGEPPRVVMKRRQQRMDWYSPWRNNVSCWDKRGNNIELFYLYGFQQ